MSTDETSVVFKLLNASKHMTAAIEILLTQADVRDAAGTAGATGLPRSIVPSLREAVEASTAEITAALDILAAADQADLLDRAVRSALARLRP